MKKIFNHSQLAAHTLQRRTIGSFYGVMVPLIRTNKWWINTHLKSEKGSIYNFIVAHTIIYCSILRVIDTLFLVAMKGQFLSIPEQYPTDSAAPGPVQ